MHTELIICGRDQVAPEVCPECGGWIHAIQRGGFDTGGNWPVCSVACAHGYAARLAQLRAADHLDLERDLLCNCADVCAPAGYPTRTHREIHAAWVANGRQPIPADEFDRLARERSWT